MIVYSFSKTEQRKSKVDKVTIGDELLYVASMNQKAYSSRVFWVKIIYERSLWDRRLVLREEPERNFSTYTEIKARDPWEKRKWNSEPMHTKVNHSFFWNAKHDPLVWILEYATSHLCLNLKRNHPKSCQCHHHHPLYCSL